MKNKKGFTLIELLVVIAIISILVVISLPSLMKNIDKAKVADLEADISSIRYSILSYYAQNPGIIGSRDFIMIYKDQNGNLK